MSSNWRAAPDEQEAGSAADYEEARPILTLEQRVDEALRIIGKVRPERRATLLPSHRMADCQCGGGSNE